MVPHEQMHKLKVNTWAFAGGLGSGVDGDLENKCGRFTEGTPAEVCSREKTFGCRLTCVEASPNSTLNSFR